MATEPRTLTRQELYELVWSTSLQKVAPQLGCSDVGLAKLCERHQIPTPPAGYWTQREFGKTVDTPLLPSPPASDTIVIEIKPDQPITENEPPFFDGTLGALAARVAGGELIAPVKASLRTCHPLTSRTRDWLDACHRPVERNRFGGIRYSSQGPQLDGPPIGMRVFREQAARALRVLDAILRTFEALGIKPEKAREEWRKVMEFEMRGYRFGLRIVERTKRHDHELTPRERSSIERTGRHWGPRYDYKPTGELRLALTYSGFDAPWAEFKETRKIPVEERIPQLVLAVLRAADDWLRRQDEAKQAKTLAEEKRLREAEEAERQRIKAERHQVDLACQGRLLDTAEDWYRTRRLRRFLLLVRAKARSSELDSYDRDLLERWLRWADSVIESRDPLNRPLGEVPDLTHPGIREAERRRGEQYLPTARVEIHGST